MKKLQSLGYLILVTVAGAVIVSLFILVIVSVIVST